MSDIVSCYKSAFTFILFQPHSCNHTQCMKLFKAAVYPAVIDRCFSGWWRFALVHSAHLEIFLQLAIELAFEATLISVCFISVNLCYHANSSIRLRGGAADGPSARVSVCQENPGIKARTFLKSKKSDAEAPFSSRCYFKPPESINLKKEKHTRSVSPGVSLSEM